MKQGWLAALLLTVACVPPAATGTGGPGPERVTRQSLRATIDSIVAAPEFRNAHFGILIVDPERGDTLYSRNAGKLFLPASNMKIVTGAVALAQLGPDFRFSTAFATTGERRDSVLAGDLVVIGRGDPTVSASMRDDPMQVMLGIADSLALRGIRRIEGTVRRGPDLFPDANLGYGWSWDDLDYPYSAGVDELFFNEGFATVHVTGGDSIGAPVLAEVEPIAGYPQLSVAATTDTAKIRLGLVRDSVTGVVVLTGAIAPRDTASVDIAYRNPGAAYLAALRTALAQRGITVADSTLDPPRVDSTARLDTLFTVQSLPLSDILPAFMKPSQNQIGEILLKTLGLEAASESAAEATDGATGMAMGQEAVEDTAVGTAEAGSAVVARQLAAWGVPEEAYLVRDGSGLSRYDYLTPEAIVLVLEAMRSDSLFYESLPIAGVDGTIRNRMRGTAAEGNVHAKTGTIAHARSLSGYVTTADGERVTFSILANNFTTRVAAVNAVQDAIVTRLARLRLR